MTRETPKAAQAFAAYIALGPTRSIAQLANDYVRQEYGKSTAVMKRVLERWSSQHHWQDRLAEATNARIVSLLAEATEVDADTFRRTSHELSDRLDYRDAVPLDNLIRLRESVRPKTKSEAGGNTTVLILNYIREEAERRGLDSAEAVRVASEIVAGAQR